MIPLKGIPLFILTPQKASFEEIDSTVLEVINIISELLPELNVPEVLTHDPPRLKLVFGSISNR